MTALPVLAVRIPSDLAGLVNGNLPADLLEQIGPVGYLHHTAARAWRALHAAAAAAGIQLTYTYGGTYRPFNDQVTLFRQRYSTIPQTGRPTKAWKSTTYWQLPGTAMAAVPGTSNHGLGLAVDTALGADPGQAKPIQPALAWLLANAPAFGWSWEVQSEAWHIRLVTGDTPTAAVLAHEETKFVAHLNTAIETAAAATTPTEGDTDMPIRILRSMTTPPEFYAQFIAYTDGAGHSVEVQWTGPGENPDGTPNAKVQGRLEALRDAGVQDQHILLAGLRNNVLHPRYQPADIKDVLHRWTADDFA